MKITITLQDVRAALDAIDAADVSFTGGCITDYDLLHSDLQDDLSLDSIDIITLVAHIEEQVGVVICYEGWEWFSSESQSVENFLKMVNDYQM